MNCPVCGSRNFYFKDPDDEYETYEFELRDGNVELSPEAESSSLPEAQDDSETFCNKCSWHGKLGELTGDSD